jgi:2-polyprenyl-3-methyl-5-hydroxy-6-metoxy-1,4-benzoquinol methylase
LAGVKTLLRAESKAEVHTIMDLGCGHGDMLRQIARYGRSQGFQFELIGIDANKDAIAYARELSADYPEIQFESSDIFSSDFKKRQCSIALCTLFLHHFSEAQIRQILRQLKEQSSLGIVINDLQRSEIAYGLFKLLGLAISNHMVKQDGLTSILRAFKRPEIEAFSKPLNLPYHIQWKWAFRYQWIINTKKHHFKDASKN